MRKQTLLYALCSLNTLKRQLTEAKAAAVAKALESEATADQPLEWGRILTEEDFERIRSAYRVSLIAIQQDAAVDHAVLVPAVELCPTVLAS